MTIKLLITGGTIDKIYNPSNGRLEFTQSCLPKMLKRGRIGFDVATEVLFLKDSLMLNDADRALILDRCYKTEKRRILISHGTDTMVKTATLLNEKIADKTIVLFGAMIPYQVKNSDALFNFGVALNAVQNKDNGVYIAMNGQVFDFDKVKKNKNLGIFEALSDGKL